MTLEERGGAAHRRETITYDALTKLIGMMMFAITWWERVASALRSSSGPPESAKDRLIGSRC